MPQGAAEGTRNAAAATVDATKRTAGKVEESAVKAGRWVHVPKWGGAKETVKYG